MAGLISTGIWGFICSATMKAGKITATFISGATGWIIKNNGDAEFKSIYARDKIVTNEYVYNRIRVTEDEEVVTSNGKILASALNDDGSYNVQLDLREGDMNPFDANDLLQGYYHSPGNTGVIYAVQKMTVVEVLDDQTMNVTCLSESTPYKYMVVVRVGNTKNPDRQSFIRISSRTNCQYFYDAITSFLDLDNPDKVKCAIGKVDVGLIPAWAASAVGSIKKWFGLIADGVILRGIFILKSSGKTIEKELEGVGETITEVETRFEIREGQISSKVEETKTYAEKAFGSATSAAGSASSAAGSASAAAGSAEASEASKVISVKKASEAKQTAEGFTQTVTETTKKAVADAVAGADAVIEEKVGTAVTQSAKQWKVEVMGSDAQGNPNTILAAINADASGIKIKGDKVEIDGTLLAKIIMATGLNINDKFLIDKDGKMIANEGVFKGKVEIAGGKILLNEDGSGELAGGGIFWDSNGVLYNRNKMRPSWRSLRTEMDEAGISPGGYYALKTEKGTYLNAFTTYDDTRIVSLPDPAQVDSLSNSLNDDIDVRVSLIGRLASAYLFTCPMGDIVIYNATTGDYNKVARVGFPNSAGGDYVGTFKVKYANGNWSWLAGGDFV